MTNETKLLTKLLAALTAKPSKSKGRKAKGRPTTESLAADCIAAFKKAGYTDVQPKVNVMTYNKWVEAGRRVRPGEKGTKVGAFTLFHISQTDVDTGQAPAKPAASAPVVPTAEQIAAYLAQKAKEDAAKNEYGQ